MSSPDIVEIKKKYRERLKKELGFSEKGSNAKISEEKVDEEKPLTLDYKKFKESYYPKQLKLYEKLCNFASKILNIEIDEKTKKKYEEAIKTTHLEVTPQGIMSLAVLSLLSFLFLGILFGFLIPFVLNGQMQFFIIILFTLIGFASFAYVAYIPFLWQNQWRLKASNQMILLVFYLATYMRNIPNLERALDFAAEHLGPPLALDLKKVIWDVSSDKYSNVKESLDHYLEDWKKWNMEFVEAIHLIESSLYETTAEKREETLDKAMELIIEENYEKLLHYSHDLKGPLTNLHMLGIVLPILGLVILPLVVSFMPEIKWYHLATLYNLILPVIVYYFSKNILSKRPGGYGETDMTEINPDLEEYKNIVLNFFGTKIYVSPSVISGTIIILGLFIGIIPLLFHVINPNYDIVLTKGWNLAVVEIQNKGEVILDLLGYNTDAKGNVKGPYGVGALIFSVITTFSLGFGLGIYYKMRVKKALELREKIRKLEKEFAMAIYQLGNRLLDNLPVETAFRKVAEVMKGSEVGEFFEETANLMISKGLSLEEAIFDERNGTLKKYPSYLIEVTMKILVRTIKEGPRAAGKAMLNIAMYVRNIQRSDERLKDLMADTLSSMKSQVGFLTPIISGIVIAITSMITTIIVNLQGKLSLVTSGGSSSIPGASAPIGGTGLLGMFNLGVPTYFFQLIVGIYLVEVVFILSSLINSIENGTDKIGRYKLIGDNLIRNAYFYTIIVIILSILFNLLAGTIIGTSSFV